MLIVDDDRKFNTQVEWNSSKFEWKASPHYMKLLILKTPFKSIIKSTMFTRITNHSVSIKPKPTQEKKVVWSDIRVGWTSHISGWISLIFDWNYAWNQLQANDRTKHSILSIRSILMKLGDFGCACKITPTFVVANKRVQRCVIFTQILPEVRIRFLSKFQPKLCEFCTFLSKTNWTEQKQS